MFDLTPVSTSNLFAAAQIIVVVFGFWFSWRSLEAARKSLEIAGQSLSVASQNVQVAGKNLANGTLNSQAQLFNQMVVQGRDLKFKYMDIFLGGDTQEDLAQRRELFLGAVISYYASCFELKQVLPLPKNVERLYRADLAKLMETKEARNKWDEIRSNFTKEFGAYVDDLRGV